MRDAVHLTYQLEKLGNGPSTAEIENALRQYESEMREYAAQALALSAAGGKVVFGFRGFDSIPEIEMHD